MTHRGSGSIARRLAGAALTFFALAAATPAHAQQGYDIRGTVVDSAGSGIGGAMVVALALPDSALTKFVQSNGEGAFVLSGIVPGSYVLQVTLLGHQTHRQEVSVTNADVQAGRIDMPILAVEMEPLVISIEHVPFLNRRDTLSYNAQAFETRPNATVEELLRRLPGIEVAEDGSIKAQGKDVQNVLVDGKEFFGSDPTIATKNLPADAIRQVQVYEKESDMAEFTGIADGEEETTINLELREEARVGYFGQISGGVGADMRDYGLTESFVEDPMRYDESLNINRFSPNTQLALIGRLNNVNDAGFQWGGGEIEARGGGFGGGGPDLGGGRDDGFTETMTLGLNANRDFGERTWIRSSYFLSTLDNLQNGTIQEQQLLGSEVSSLVGQTRNVQADNTSHSLNLNAQLSFAEGHELRLRGNLGVRSSTNTTATSQQTTTPDGDPLNSAVTDYLTDSDNVNGDARLTWRKRLGESGRTLVAEARADLSDSDRFADLSSAIERTLTDGSMTTEEIIQEQLNEGRTFNQQLRLSWTEPIGSEAFVELFGEREAIDEDEDKSVFDLGSGAPIFNDLQSSAFDRTYTYLRGGTRLSRNTDRTRMTLGLQVQNSNLDGIVLDRDETITSGYTHFLPFANLRFELDDGRNLSFNYRTSTREPSMTDLQPFVDNRDPLNVYIGNPDLTPEYTHRLNADYRFFDAFSFLNLFTYANVNYTTNDITTARTVDAQGLQMRSPINSGNTWSTNGGINFGTPIRPLGVRVNLNYNLSYSRGTEFVNDEENDTRTIGNTIGIKLDNRSKSKFDVAIGTDLNFSSVDYSLNERLSQGYLNSVWYATGAFYLGSWTLDTRFNYQRYDQDLFGPGNNIAMWQMSISRLILGDRGEVAVTAFDLLDQNQGVRFTNSATSIREQRTQALGQYVMLKFNYRLGANPGGGRGGPGGFRGGDRRR